MSDEGELSIERITRLANEDVRNAISEKIGRSLTDDESNAIFTTIGTEHFWARAEELLMFVQHRNANEVLDTIATLRTQFRNGELALREASHESTPPVTGCDMCKGTGNCYCIRKGPGIAAGCPRCAGSAKCRRCQGKGTR